MRDGLPGLRDVWQIDNGGLDELATAGADTTDAELDERRARVRRGDVATIIYTSGTTGRPKGCELTHDNFMALAENTVERLGDVVSAKGASTLLFLPLAHVFARFIEVLCVQSGARMGHTADIRNLLDDFGSSSPTFILAVPRVFEKIYNSAEQKATAEGKGRIFAVRRQHRHRLEPRLGRRAARPAAAPQARPVRAAGLHQAARVRWAARSSTPSPAAAPSASGSATSTAASA